MDGILIYFGVIGHYPSFIDQDNDIQANFTEAEVVAFNL